MLLNSGGVNNFTRELKDKLAQNEDWGESIDKLEAAPHEKMGAMLILDKLKGAIEKIFDDLRVQKYPTVRADNILYAEHYNNDSVIDKEDLQRDICFIARMILGLKYKGYEPEKQIRNCFIELLNGGNFDVDKLDYVVRDTQMSGISNTNVDVERLLTSVCIITKTKYVDYIHSEGSFSNRVITRMSGNADSDITIKGYFRGDILLKSGAEVRIAGGSTFLSFQPIDHTQIKYIEGSEAAKFTAKTTIIQNGGEITWKSGIAPNETKTLPVMNGEYFECSIRNAEVLERGFCFNVEDKENTVGAVKIQIKGYCKINIKGEFAIKSAISCFRDTVVEGSVKEAVLLGNSIKDAVPGSKIYNEFSVGFKKQAINVIANVLEARNYLYLWIYAHHKVTYYANFLIPVLAGQVLRQINSEISSLDKETAGTEGTLSIWPLNYSGIQYLDDSYFGLQLKIIITRGWEREQNGVNCVRNCWEENTKYRSTSLWQNLICCLNPLLMNRSRRFRII